MSKPSKEIELDDHQRIEDLFDRINATQFTTKEYFTAILILSTIVFVHIVLTISFFIFPSD